MMSSSMLTNNTATRGGAIYQAKGELWLDKVTLTGNESTWDGGLYQAGGSATLTEKTKIFGNVTRKSYGIAVAKAKGASLTINDSNTGDPIASFDQALSLYLDEMESFL